MDAVQGTGAEEFLEATRWAPPDLVASRNYYSDEYICCAVLSTTPCYVMLTLPLISVGTLLHRSVNIMKPKSLFIQNVAVGSLMSSSYRLDETAMCYICL